MPIHQVDKLTELLIFSFPESSQDCTLTAQKKIPLPVSGKVVIQLNAKGGIALLGVEDDGKVTGSHPNHRHHLQQPGNSPYPGTEIPTGDRNI
jgi:hypothetical protein